MSGSQHARRARVLLAALVTATGLGLAAADVEPWPDGSVQVERVHRADVYEIARGGSSVPLRLAGLWTFGRLEREVDRDCRRQVMARLDAGAPRLVDGKTNGRGELEGILRLYDGSTLNERLLAAGCALLAPTLPERFAPALRAAQRSASQRRVGVWGGVPLRVEDVRRVYGRIATVCGNAGAVHQERGGDWLIHLGERYPRHKLTVRIAREHAHVFEKPDEVYLRHELCVTGSVVLRRAAAEIVAVDPSQIRDEGGMRAR